MAKHEITIYENKGATKEIAPFLANYVSKESRFLDELCALAAHESGLPEIQIRAILTGSFEAFAELEKEGPVRIATDIGVICLVINEAFPSADAPFDPLVNRLQLTLMIDESVRNCLANVTPSIVTDATSTKVRLDTVADVAEPRPYNVIHGVAPFECQGYNLVMSDEGAGVMAVNAAGTEFPCEVVEAGSKQLVKAKFPAAVPPGDYKLYVKSRGGDAEGSLQRPFRCVKVLRTPAPTLVVTGATSCVNPWTIHGPSGAGQFHMVGENIIFTAGAEDEGVWFTYTDPETGEEVVKYAPPSMVHDESGSGTAPWILDDEWVGGNPPGGGTIHGTLKIACRAGVPGSELQVFTHDCNWQED